MKIIFFLLIEILSLGFTGTAQLIFYKNQLSSPYAIANIKAEARKARMIKEAESLLTLPIGADEDSAEPINLALWNVSQFLIRTPISDSGITRLTDNFDKLSPITQQSLLEVIYGSYPNEYYTQMLGILQQVNHPKSFATAAAYIYRAHPTAAGEQLIRQQAARILPKNESHTLIVKNLLDYIDNYNKPQTTVPNYDSLFARQQIHKFKVIYSFQRKNRNFSGLAIVQNADGSFVRDSLGNVSTFVQLARSASNLPWFITNGSTPQGLYTITGIGHSKNPFIGPTPNLQMAMMGEVNPPEFTHFFPPIFNAPPEKVYRSYFPENWQNRDDIMQAYMAGKIGRSEIIAHGSTVDPEWYKGATYFPLSPTMGCLSGLESWNKVSGKISQSDQLNLVNAFIQTSGTQGFLIVVDLDDSKKPVLPADIYSLAVALKVKPQN